MKLRESLGADRVLVGDTARDLKAAAVALLGLPTFSDAIQGDDASEIAEALSTGEGGIVVRASEDAMIAAVESPTADGLRSALGVFPSGFQASTPREGEPAPARVLLLIATPGRLASLRAEAFPRLVRALRFGGVVKRLLRADSPTSVLEIDELMDTELHGELKVRDAMSPVSYRIYPDTPLDEVIDLMVRRGVRVLPVVGPEYEVLGLITIGDVLRVQVPKWLGGDEAERRRAAESETSARDIMTRSVMGVAEDQTLLDAARILANKGFEHLPVVRDGELVGFVAEETVLRMLSNR